MKQLKVGLMGLAGVGADYLSVLIADEQFELVGVADGNTELLRRFAETSSVPAYEDCRSLIVERSHDGLDLLFVALEPFESIDFVELAAQRGVAVFHKAPFARTVGEGQRLVRTFESADCPLVVSRSWQSDPAFSRWCRPVIDQGSVNTAVANLRMLCEPSGWRGDSARAGGGILLNGAYEQVDLLVQCMGLPETVYALCVIASPTGVACPYDTEDAAQVLLRFSGRRIGCITAWRDTVDSAWSVVLVAPDRTIELDGKPTGKAAVAIRGRDSTKTHRMHPQRAMAAAISAFGAYRAGGGVQIESHAREHLSTLAVMEAAYLSAKTGQPESPARFLA